MPREPDDMLGRVCQEHASGVEKLPNTIRRSSPWRAHPWDGKRHVHLGYYTSWEKANFAVRLWHACRGSCEEDGIDCSRWFPQVDYDDDYLATLTLADIERIAKERRI